MSQNKTKIQGLELDNAQSRPSPQASPSASGFYARSSSAPHGGTVVAGMMENDQPKAASSTPTAMPGPSQKAYASGKPIVGFLYSVSRSMAGEFWPLHVGSNTIGNDLSCDIVLGEGTVSRMHATLQVRRAKNSGSISAWISDTMSTNGTIVNDVCLGSTPVDCKNGDIITIGDNYELYLTLIDTSLLNLKVSEDFIPVQVDSQSSFDDPSSIAGGAASADSFDPWGNAYTPTPGTVGIDGSTDPSHGGTIPL